MKMSNESVLKEILEQSLAGYWDWDIPSGDEFLSPTFKKMFGYEDHEIPNRAESWQKLIFPEDLPRVLESFEEHVKSAGKIPYNHEVRYRHKNGSTVWVICTGNVIEWNENGQPVRMVGCHINITERKKVEAELRIAKDYAESLIETANALVVVLDESGNIQVFNKYAENITGYSLADLKGKNWFEVLVPRNRYPEVWKEFTRLLEGGVPRTHENPILTKHGDERIIMWQNSNILSQEKIIGTISFGIDITELKRSEILTRTALENFPLIFYMIDRSGIFRLSIGAGLKGLGLEQNQVVGISAFEIYKDYPEITSALTKALSGKRATFESTVAGSSYFNVCIPASGWFDGLAAVALDITDRKRNEETLLRVQKLDSLGILAGGIAHDFNNLLAGIYGYMDIAREIATDHNLHEYISKAMNTIDRGRHLTLQLLTFAKGGIPIKSIGTLFPDLSEIVKFALSGSNITCTFDVAGDLHTCNFDKNQISQVIDNIVINAKQAMPDGGKIEVSARNITFYQGQHASLDPGEYVRISIRDYGIGMTREILPRIFDPFYTTKATGYGLGLATCYSIIKRHGGYIDVESEPGNGSTFHVYLPATVNTPALSEQKNTDKHKGNGTFIVMDDEEVIRETMTRMLESFGYSVLCVKDGQEAVDALASEIGKGTIAGLFLDLTIPGAMGGKEAINVIRKMSAAIPVFVVSGYAEDPVMANPKEYGFIASICKPFRKIELAALLNTHLPK